MLFEKGEELQAFLIGHLLRAQQVTPIHKSLRKCRSEHQFSCGFPRNRIEDPIAEGVVHGRWSRRRAFLDFVNLSADVLGHHEIVLFGLLLPK